MACVLAPRLIGCTLAALLLAAPGPGLAQGGSSTVYRCADGQYSQTPCPGGRPLDTGPAPTPQQQREARKAAATEARLAEQLRQERHARERAAVGQGPARIGPLPEQSSAPKAKRPAKAANRPPKATKKAVKATGEGAKDEAPPKRRRPAASKPASAD